MIINEIKEINYISNRDTPNDSLDHYKSEQFTAKNQAPSSPSGHSRNDDLVRENARLKREMDYMRRNSDPSRTPANQNMRCFNCSRLGHFSRECRAPRRMNTQWSPNNGGNWGNRDAPPRRDMRQQGYNYRQEGPPKSDNPSYAYRAEENPRRGNQPQNQSTAEEEPQRGDGRPPSNVRSDEPRRLMSQEPPRRETNRPGAQRTEGPSRTPQRDGPPPSSSQPPNRTQYVHAVHTGRITGG